MFLPGYIYNVIKHITGFCVIYLLSCTISFAQITLFNNETRTSFTPETLSFFVDSSKDRSWKRYETIKQNLAPYSENSFSLSYKNKMVWIRLKPGIIKSAGQPMYLMVRNPHINFLGAWLLKNDRLIESFPLTGDRLPFNTRTIKHPDFLFPLSKDSLQLYSYVLLIDKRNEVVHIPLHLLTDTGLSDFDRKKNLLAGLFTGIILFLLVFNFFLYFNTKDRLYIFYGIYVLLALFYILSDSGYTFMFFFPEQPLLSDYLRPLSINMATPVYLLFCMELLNVKKNLPVYYRWMMRLLVVTFIIFVISIFILSTDLKLRPVLAATTFVIVNLLTFCNIATCVASYRKKVPYTSFILFVSLMVIAGFALFSLYLNSKVPDTFFTRNVMKITIAVEIVVLAMVLSLRFKSYKQQSENLLRQSRLQQEQIFKTVTDYQEKELMRLSSLLHDSIGARLSALRFNLESEKTETMQTERTDKVIAEINDLTNEVRRFSHGLSPVLLQEKGLKEALRQFISPINENGQLYIQFEMIGSIQRSSYRYELLIYSIIQELIQNIIKHSHASEAIVQLLLEDDLISIFVEDNGGGFDKNLIKDGLGFSQIKQLITFVKGTLQLDTAENNGTRVSIEFTTIPDEGKYPDTHS
jgi:two-component system, sensor histidine kinase LadS